MERGDAPGSGAQTHFRNPVSVRWSALRLTTERQAGIIRLLLERGAPPTDKGARGGDVPEAATSEWIRVLFDGRSD